MNFKRTLLMGLLLSVVVFYIFRVEIPEEEVESKKDTVFVIPQVSSWRSIEIAGAKGNFKFTNSAPKPAGEIDENAPTIETDAYKTWGLDSVAVSDLDRSTFNSFINALKDLKTEGSIPENEVESDLSVYGLKEPALVVKVNQQASTTEIQFGKKNDFIAKRFGKIVGLAGFEKISLFNESLFSAADKTSEDFRNKSPVDFVDTEVKSISVSGGPGSIDIESGENGTWQLVQPVKGLASSSALGDLTRELRNLRVAEFIEKPDLNLTDYKLDTPEVRVTLTFKESSKREPLEVSLSPGPKDKDAESTYFAVKGKNAVFKMLGNPLITLSKPADALREKKLFALNVESVSKASFEIAPDQKIALVKTNEVWTINDKPADDVFVRALLSTLSDVEASAFPTENKDFGFGAPRYKATLVGGGKDGGDKIFMVGAETKLASGEKAYFASVDASGDAIIISEDALKKIQPKEEALVKPTPAPAPAQAEIVSGASSATPVAQ